MPEEALQRAGLGQTLQALRKFTRTPREEKVRDLLLTMQSAAHNAMAQHCLKAETRQEEASNEKTSEEDARTAAFTTWTHYEVQVFCAEVERTMQEVGANEGGRFPGGGVKRRGDRPHGRLPYMLLRATLEPGGEVHLCRASVREPPGTEHLLFINKPDTCQLAHRDLGGFWVGHSGFDDARGCGVWWKGWTPDMKRRFQAVHSQAEGTGEAEHLS
jgi:hypothetical protein